PHRPGRAAVRPALDGAGAAFHPGGRGQADAAGVRSARRAVRARRGDVHRRAVAAGRGDRRSRPRLRDRTGPARSRPDPPLHAAGRRAGRGAPEPGGTQRVGRVCLMRILITGSGSGLGKAMATRFARDGWRVLVSDVDVAAGEAVAKELEAAFLRLDVTDTASWAAALDWCEREWGGLDVLVNNAGVASGGRFERISIED